MKKHTNRSVPKEEKEYAATENISANEKQSDTIKNGQPQEKQKKYASPEKSAAIYSLWFGLDYGSILTAFALYKAVEKLGKKPYLIQKAPSLWSNHYADKDNIAGKFIYENCDVLEAFTDDMDRQFLDSVRTHIVGSDVMWDSGVINNADDMYFYLKNVNQDYISKIAYGTSFGGGYDIPVVKRSDCSLFLHKFDGISVKSFRESVAMNDMFNMQPEIVLDPVFSLCKEQYIQCSEKAVAKEIEEQKSFVFSYIKNGDERKRDLVLRGYTILLEKYMSPLRNFIDINRYPESKAALGLDPAYHILVNDWLYYLINSDFVITDDYYGMCFAIIFRKNFVVVCGRNMKDISRFTTLLDQLGLMERLIYLDDDFKTKEYLFRKPIRYNKCFSLLEEMKEKSSKWLENKISEIK